MFNIYSEKPKEYKIASNTTYNIEEWVLATAQKYGLEEEVQYLLDRGFSPLDALEEWDII